MGNTSRLKRLAKLMTLIFIITGLLSVSRTEVQAVCNGQVRCFPFDRDSESCAISGYANKGCTDAKTQTSCELTYDFSKKCDGGAQCYITDTCNWSSSINDPIIPPPPVGLCPNGKVDSGETCENCPADVGVCPGGGVDDKYIWLKGKVSRCDGSTGSVTIKLEDDGAGKDTEILTSGDYELGPSKGSWIESGNFQVKIYPPSGKSFTPTQYSGRTQDVRRTSGGPNSGYDFQETGCNVKPTCSWDTFDIRPMTYSDPPRKFKIIGTDVNNNLTSLQFAYKKNGVATWLGVQTKSFTPRNSDFMEYSFTCNSANSGTIDIYGNAYDAAPYNLKTECPPKSFQCGAGKPQCPQPVLSLRRDDNDCNLNRAYGSWTLAGGQTGVKYALQVDDNYTPLGNFTIDRQNNSFIGTSSTFTNLVDANRVAMRVRVVEATSCIPNPEWVTVYKDPCFSPQCGGRIASGGEMCPGDDTGLTSVDTWHQVNNCGTRKCEYLMPSTPPPTTPPPTTPPPTTPPPTPKPVVLTCNQSGCNDANKTCIAGLSCINNRCRLSLNPTSTTCKEPPNVITLSCNQTGCNDANKICTTGLSCISNTCRLADNPTSRTCSPPPATVTLTCNQTGCNDANKICAVGLSCINDRCRLALNPTSTTCKEPVTPTPPPATVTLTCNQTGCNDANKTCIAGLSCINDRCRLATNRTSTTCQEITTLTCNQTGCNDANKTCAVGLSCILNTCRLALNPLSTTCKQPPGITTLTCNQTGCDNLFKTCEVGLSCINNTCRLALNPTSTTCKEPTAPPPPVTLDCNDIGCNDANKTCAVGLICHTNNRCRLSANPTSTTCQPAAACSVGNFSAPNVNEIIENDKTTISWTAPPITSGTISSYIVRIVPRNENRDSSPNKIDIVTNNTTVEYTPDSNQTNRVDIYVKAITSCGDKWSDLKSANYKSKVEGNFYEDPSATPIGLNDCTGNTTSANMNGEGTIAALRTNGTTLGDDNSLGNNYSITTPYLKDSTWGNPADVPFNLKLNINATSTVTCICPADCQYTDNVSPTNKNFYVSSIDLSNGPWWQTSGGNVFGKDSISTNIPNTCSGPSCQPYIVAKNSFADAGFPITQNNSINNGEGGGYSDRNGNGKVLNADHSNVRKEDYDYFATEIDFSKATKIDDNRINNLPTGATAIDDTEIYYKNGDLVIRVNNTKTVNIGKKILIFVDGNLTIDAPNNGTQVFEVREGGYLGFIVKGDITISPDLGHVVNVGTTGAATSNLDGVYLANKSINIQGYSASQKDKKFVGEGTFVAWEGFKFDRDFDNTTSQIDKSINNINPIEVFNFRPDFNVNTPEVLKRPSLVWQEVN